jgi:sulfur dioxygenase
MTTRQHNLEAGSGLGYDEIDPADLAHFGAARLIDVREPYEFEGELCHIAGSELVPLAGLEDAARRWEKGARIVMICRSGRRSAEGAARLARLGFSHVFNLRGGMQAYRAAGLPTECGPCLR